MQTNRVKQTLNQGGVSLGTMSMEFDTPGLPRLAAEAGAEFILFDMEHTGWSVETIRRLVAVTPAEKIVPLVRVPSAEYHFIARVLDVGAMGLMVPMVQSVEQAELLARSAQYPPEGRRGAAFGIAHDGYRQGDIFATMRAANENVLLIAQIETVQGLDRADDIAAVEGIDVLWIGQFDLTNSLGIPGQFDHPEFHQAVDRVLEACRRHRKTAGYMATDVANAREMIDRGFGILGYGGDLWIYQQGLQAGLNAVREHLADSR